MCRNYRIPILKLDSLLLSYMTYPRKVCVRAGVGGGGGGAVGCWSVIIIISFIFYFFFFRGGVWLRGAGWSWR